MAATKLLQSIAHKVSLLSFQRRAKLILSCSMRKPCFFTRETWKANPPRRNVSCTHKKLPYVFCIATSLDFSHRVSNCSNQMRILQFRHMKSFTVPDIKYNFVICGHGTVFQGRGFGRAPGLPMKYLGLNNASLFIGLHGIFEENPPTPEMLQSLNYLIKIGMEQRFIAPRIALFHI